MVAELTIVAPLIGLVGFLMLAGRPDPLRRERQEQAWREQIRAAGLTER